jgi:hypothetical protein
MQLSVDLLQKLPNHLEQDLVRVDIHGQTNVSPLKNLVSWLGAENNLHFAEEN